MTITYWAILDSWQEDSLKLLAACFTEPECRVEWSQESDDTGTWTLRSSELEYAARPVRSAVGPDAGAVETMVHEGHTLGDAMDAVDAWTAARLQAMNGAARLLDPHFEPVRIVELRGKRAGSGITVIHEKGYSNGWRPVPTRPATTLETQNFARQSAALALMDETVATVLAVLTARPTWVALGLVLNAIGDDLGGQQHLEVWLDKADLRRLTGSINFSRKLGEGPRHLGKIDGKWNSAMALPLGQAHGLVVEIVNRWVRSKFVPGAGEGQQR